LAAAIAHLAFYAGFTPAIGFSHRNDLYAGHLNLPGAAH
jgi:uncharacterized membrane protein YoaK (UPF0700 family)